MAESGFRHCLIMRKIIFLALKTRYKLRQFHRKTWQPCRVRVAGVGKRGPALLSHKGNSSSLLAPWEMLNEAVFIVSGSAGSGEGRGGAGRGGLARGRKRGRAPATTQESAAASSANPSTRSKVVRLWKMVKRLMVGEWG